MSKTIALACLIAFLPLTARAETKAGDWEFTLGGGGSNNKGFTQGSFLVNGSAGFYLTPNIDLTLRQAVSYDDHNNGTNWQGNSRLALDYNFQLQPITPYIGANIGYLYGDGLADTWEAAPEVGLKWYVRDRTFIYAQAEYDFFFRNSGGIGSGFKNGEFVYSIGIGFNLP